MRGSPNEPNTPAVASLALFAWLLTLHRLPRVESTPLMVAFTSALPSSVYGWWMATNFSSNLKANRRVVVDRNVLDYLEIRL
jgi:hypothetical protein